VISLASTSAPSAIVFGQTIKNASVLGNDSSPGLDQLRSDLNGSQNDNAAAHGRLH